MGVLGSCGELGSSGWHFIEKDDQRYRGAGKVWLGFLRDLSKKKND